MGTRTCRILAAAALAVGVALFPAATRAAETAEHTVRPGDNLHLIAGYYYRDPRQWARIWRENRAKLRDPHRLHPGSSLRVPPGPGPGWEIPYEEFRARVRGR